MANVTLAGFVYNNAGDAISSATVEAFTRNTSSSAVGTTTSNSSGYWTLSVADQMYDVRITYGSSIRWIKYDDQSQMETLEVANFFIRDPDNTYDYNIKPAAIGADYELNLPLLTGNDTLAAIGFAQTWTADQTFNDSVKVTLGTGGDADLYYDGTDVVLDVTVVGSGDFYVKGGRVEVDDDEGVAFGTGKDATISYDGTDLVVTPAAVGSGDLKITGGSLLIADSESATFGTGKDATISYDGTDLIITPAAVGSGDVSISGGSLEVGDAEGTRYGAGQDAELRWSTGDSDNHAFVVGVGASNAAMHIANIGDIATDWNVSAEADPQLFIHCNTNPATEYLRIGNLDATNAEIDLVGGTTINLQIDGTTEASLTASVFNLGSGNTYQINGTDVITASALGTGMQADQAAIEGQTNENTYVPPDLMHHHPGVAKAWCFIAAAGTLSSPDYGVASVDDNGTGDRDVNYDTAFSSSVYSAIANNAHGSSNIARNVNVSLTTGDCSIFINDAESNAASDQNNCFVAFGDH